METSFTALSIVLSADDAAAPDATLTSDAAL
jgi:hypothetical protein